MLGEIARTSKLIENRTLAMDDPDLDLATSKVFAGQIAKASVKLEELSAQRERLSQQVTSARAKDAALHNVEDLKAALRAGGSPELRARLRTEIRKRVLRIEFTWNQDGVAFAHIIFINGATLDRGILFGKDGSVTACQQTDWQRV